MPAPNNYTGSLARLAPDGSARAASVVAGPHSGSAVGPELQVDLCVIGGGSGGFFFGQHLFVLAVTPFEQAQGTFFG